MKYIPRRPFLLFIVILSTGSPRTQHIPTGLETPRPELTLISCVARSNEVYSSASPPAPLLMVVLSAGLRGAYGPNKTPLPPDVNNIESDLDKLCS